MSNPADTSLPRVSVAVINFNGADTLRPTLQSVFALQHIRLAEVFLVDNHSEDDSLALVRRDFPGVRVIGLSENRGPNPARNEGLRRATADGVLIMDNDIVLADDYVMRLVNVFRTDPSAGAVSGQIRLYDQPDKVQYNGITLHYAGEIAARPLDAHGTVRVPCVSAGAALFNRCHALVVGGFDDNFIFGWEDGDLTFRLSLTGHPCYLASEAKAYHLRRARGRKWVRYQTRNRWWFMRKNYDPRTFWLVLPAVFSLQFCAGCFCLVKGQGGAFLKGTWDGARSGGALRAKRREVQRLRTVADTDLLQGDRLDLPGGLTASRTGRLLNAVVNAVFRLYWRLIRPCLRRR
ncbi:MAG: glycosyltransferase [Kiritimatiellae bacterium]|nr:glycosyltransferase [Verrucomicrobiota bacterium]MBU4285359.1 glycosyltransferase [Verrucomicrobiota bacterium]MBU4366888.1 glycosyltransferase [Verrucomicrobiota bacterium]MCG2659131.1 glycosyltransferase [Kiritimatiellia bacterium]